MVIDAALLDTLTEQAKSAHLLRLAFDLRTTPDDNSQRILNAMEPGTVIPVHRHRASSETVVVLRGRICQKFYNNDGTLKSSEICSTNTPIMGFNIPVGEWHNMECLDSGTVILEFKDGPYEPLSAEDILEIEQ